MSVRMFSFFSSRGRFGEEGHWYQYLVGVSHQGCRISRSINLSGESKLPTGDKLSTSSGLNSGPRSYWIGCKPWELVEAWSPPLKSQTLDRFFGRTRLTPKDQAFFLSIVMREIAWVCRKPCEIKGTRRAEKLTCLLYIYPWRARRWWWWWWRWRAGHFGSGHTQLLTVTSRSKSKVAGGIYKIIIDHFLCAPITSLCGLIAVGQYKYPRR